MKKPQIFAYVKTKAQISYCEADQRLCFRYTDSTISLLPKSEISSFWPFSETVQTERQLTSDLVGNPEDRFSRVMAHI